MSRRAFRFRPPEVAMSPEIRWMLLRAFGPPGAPFAEAFAPAAALEMARRFEVSVRIAARQGRARLGGEVAEAAAGFQRDQAAAAALGMRLLSLIGDLAAAAEPLGLPLVFLKFAALEQTGVTAPGARPACDIDVLVPEARARELQRALLARGWRASGMPDMEHQLTPLQHPHGGIVEVHRRMLGVRPGGREKQRASATAETLERGGLLVPLSDLPGRCAAPVRAVLAAHALVHGIGQHGFWPASYPLFKMIADLIDLGLHTDDALARRAAVLVAADVSAGEVAAVRELCAALATGADPPPDAAALLRHILAGRLDPGYAASLRLGFFQDQPSDRPPALRLTRAVVSAVFLSRAQIDAIYGPPLRPLGYLGRRLARPFDLLLRLGRYRRAKVL